MASQSPPSNADTRVSLGDQLALVLTTVAWAWIGWVGDTRAEPLAFMGGYAVASLGYAWLAWRIVQRRAHISLATIAVVALLIRLAVIGAPPSDDMARYIWEGRVVAAGSSPYLLAPDAPEFASLAATAPEHAGINHSGWTAIYPPFTMLWHTAVATVSPRALAFKLTFLMVEVVIAALILALLRHRHLDDTRIALFALNPLVVWAVALEGHHEPLAAAWLLAALVMIDRGRHAGAGASWVLACASKGFACVVAPALWGRLAARGWVAALSAAVLVTLPFVSSSSGLVASLARFGSELSVNDTLHAVAQDLAPSPTIARAALVACGVAVALWLITRRRQRTHDRDATWEAAVLLATLVLLLPTVHPWYLYTLVPLLCLWPWPGWIALTLTVSLTWLPHLVIRHSGVWVEWRSLIPIEYGPLFTWLVIVAWRKGAAAWTTRSTRPTSR